VTQSTVTTLDGLLGGRVSYRQPIRGYRVALEAPLLARFAIEGRARAFRRAVDLGAGPGAIVLALVVTGWAVAGLAIEPDAVRAELARQNVHDNRSSDRIEVSRTSVERVDARFGRADLVIANPPYFSPNCGPVAPDDSRASARALRSTSVAAFARAARRLLGRDGRFVVAFPSQRLAELLDALAEASLVAKRIRFVHPRTSREAQVVRVEAKPAKKGGLVVEPPLVVRGEGEAYTSEVDDALRGRWPLVAVAIAPSAGG